MTTERTDEALIDAYLAGDERAFDALVKRHLNDVYSFVFRSVRDDVEDIVQEVFLKVWKNLKRYDQKSAKFRTWLMRIARNTVIDHLRKKKSIAFSDLENDDGENPLAQSLPDPEPLPDELAARAHDEMMTREILGDLPQLYREVMLLHYMNHLSFEEIGTVLDTAPNTIRSRHRRGLDKLRRRLETLH